MKKKTLVIGSLAGAGVLVAGVGIWAVVGRGDGNTSDNVVYVNSVENIMNPGSGNGAINRFAGVVETQQKLEIQVEQDKTVKEVFVEEGQTVEGGTPLFEYDTEKTEEEISKAKLELERISNTIGNKYNEIDALEKEKNSADQEAKLDYTMQIQSAQMELKQSEYEKKSKQVEIQKLQDTLENAQVESEMAGVVKSINDGSSGEMNYNGESQAFMTIIAMGDFRIKGKINEQNMGAIISGQPVIIHSRVDEDVTWKGTMGEVDMQNPGNDSGNFYMSSGDGTTQSNSYPFYVNLDSSEGLMLGQHVYIEADYGQEEKKAGIWLDESFVCDVDAEPYVWVDNGKGKLEKREITLGQHDEELFQYEIADGLTAEDLITYPEDGLKEGMATAKGENGRMGQSNPEMPEEDPGLEMPDTESVPEGETVPEEGDAPADDGMLLYDGETEGAEGAADQSNEISGGTEDGQ